MVKILVRQWLPQEENKSYFTSNNTMALYGIHLFVNWTKKNHKQALKQFLKEEGCKEHWAELTFLDLAVITWD